MSGTESTTAGAINERGSRRPASAFGRRFGEARNGGAPSLGDLLESYRNYLQLLATTQLDEKLRSRVSPSDLVQETMMGAYRDFASFRGTDERQFLAWLRKILINRLHVFVQHHVFAEKRDIRRECSLQEVGRALARSTAQLRSGRLVSGPEALPSEIVAGREDAVTLANELAHMPPEYRTVILLRNLQGLSFVEVAARMKRNSGATRMLWLRAIKRLRERMRAHEREDQD